MAGEKKTYKLDCAVPPGTMIRESIMFIVFVVFTAGLALPLMIFRIAKVIIKHTEVSER